MVIHGYNKSDELAGQLINKGLYLSLHQSLFKTGHYGFENISLERIFLETDNNKEISIVEVYKKAANHFKITEDELKEKIYANFVTLFNKNGR